MTALDKVQTGGSIVQEPVRKAIQDFCARLSHDFNNLLTPLLAYPGMIAVELPKDGKALKLLRAQESAAEGAVAVMRRLGDLSGAMRKGPRSFNAAEVVETVLSVLKELPAAAGVRMEREIAEGGAVVHMSQDALTLSVEELGRNALQALQGRGTMTARVERLLFNAPFQTVSGLAPAGCYTAVHIEDDGIGMSAAMLQSAVEPFCSGFGGGKRCGTGLGLSIAYCALRENGAYLTLESEEGKGTLASILVPDAAFRTAEAQAAAAETVSVLGTLESGNAPRILVVDDEPSILNLFKLILENYIQGVAVDKASNGAEALKMFGERRYDVIVMDLHMPVMDGQTAFLEIERQCRSNGWPMPSVVFCTGYAPRDVVKQAISEGTRHTLLNKPVRSETLVKAVQTRLEANL